MVGLNIDASKLRLISDISLDLHAATDLEAALSKSITVILENMKARQCYLYTRPRSSDVIILEAASPGFEDLIGIIGYEKNEGLTGTIFARGKGCILNDPPQHPEIWKGKYAKEFFERCDDKEVKTIMGAPLIYKDETIGVIIITNRTKDAESPYFSQSDLNFLELLAKNISGAIENARMRDEVTLHNEILNLMPDLKSDKVLQTILSGITRILKCDSGIIFVVDEENKLIRSIYSIGFDKEIANNLIFSLSRKEDALVVRSVIDGIPYFAEDASNDPRVNKVAITALGIQGPMIMYPLKLLEGKVIGAISLSNRGPGRPLNRYDTEVIRPYVSYAALAIRAAQDRRRVETDRQELKLLNDIILHMTESTERDKLLNGVVSKAKQALRSDFCGVFLSDDPPKILMPRDAKYSLCASDGLNIPQSDTIFCLIGRGPIGKAIHTGNIVEHDMTKDSAALDECSQKLKSMLNAELASFLVCPLKDRQSIIIGALVFVRTRLSEVDGKIFTSRDKEMATIIAAELSIALMNQNLYENLHGEINRETEQITSIFDALGCELSIVEKVKKDDGTSDMIIRYVNDKQKEKFGDITNQICHWAYNRFEKPCTWCPVIPTLYDGKIHMSITYSPVKGEWKRYLVVASPYDRWENGEVRAVLEVIVDLTEREIHLESVIDLHANMINATSVLEVGKNVVELVTDIMKWDIGLFFLRSRREPSLLKLLYEKGLGLEQEDIGNISYKKELLSTDVLLRPYIYKVDDVNEQWKAEKAIYSETVQVKLQNMKRVFVFPLNSPYIGEIGVLKGYSTSTIAVADEEFEFEYLRVIEYIAKCGAATCERIRRQESMIPNTTNEEDE